MRNNIGVRPKREDKQEKDRVVNRQEFRENYDNRRKDRSKSKSESRDFKGRRYDNGDRHKRYENKNNSRTRSRERDRKRRE